MNLERTRIHCPTCGTFHPADYVEVDGVAFWRVHCPHGDRDVGLSSDARLFRKFRDQARPLPSWYRRSFTNCLVHVNDDCSLQCPVCFENAPRHGWRMSLEELRKTMHRLRAEVKPVNIMITGGEPTEHPQILDIVRIIARRYGFHCSVLTNGVKIGREPGFAASLKEAGLSRVTLSFDTFKPEISEIIRGRGDLVDLKLRAVENCDAAELNCGLETTACRLNLQEIPKMAAFSIARAGRMSLYDVQCYQPSGRVAPGLESVDREAIVKTMVASGVVPGLTEDEFRTSPCIPAMGYCLNPDCAAYVLWTVKNGVAEPINRTCDYDGLLSDLYHMPPGSRMRKRVSFGLAFLRRLGLRRLLMLRKSLRYSSDDGEHLQMFSISSLMTPDRLDSHRFGRCFSGVVTPSGAICPPCYYYGMRFPHILKARSGAKQGKEGA